MPIRTLDAVAATATMLIYHRIRHLALPTETLLYVCLYMCGVDTAELCLKTSTPVSGLLMV